MSARADAGHSLLALGIGVACGVGLALVDTVAFHGEVSPIVIVALLLTATFTAGLLGGRRGWIVAVCMWSPLPLVHAVKHLLTLPDTLHPNTWSSLLTLAAFTLVVADAGVVCGSAVHRSSAAARR